MKHLIFIIALTTIFAGCKTTKRTAMPSTTTTSTAAQTAYAKPATAGNRQTALSATLIYKTKADYSQNVPVLLSADKKHIVSYPAPSDLKHADGYATPIPLANGYLLDRRGISPNVAFLKYTYREYAALPAAPSPATLFDSIIDTDPLVELWNCGTSPITTEQLISIIKSNQLPATFQRLK